MYLKQDGIGWAAYKFPIDILAASYLQFCNCGCPAFAAGASEEEVYEAARSANAHKFISALPAGYLTQVGRVARGCVPRLVPAAHKWHVSSA